MLRNFLMQLILILKLCLSDSVLLLHWIQDPRLFMFLFFTVKTQIIVKKTSWILN